MTNKPSNSDDFLWGEELFAREYGLEDEVERVTDQLLADGQLGERAPECIANSGTL